MAEGKKTLWFQQPAHAIGMVCAVIVAYYMFPGGQAQSSTLHNFAHLLAFSTLFGIQIWTTFVTGVVLIKTLPRHMFGLAQGALFPIYFGLGLFLSSLVLASYLARHPVSTWSDTEPYQVAALGVVLSGMAINGLYASPSAIRAMQEMYSMEDDEAGRAVGNKVSEETKLRPEYARVYYRFVRLHGISALANLLCLGASVFHLYYLSGNINF